MSIAQHRRSSPAHALMRPTCGLGLTYRMPMLGAMAGVAAVAAYLVTVRTLGAVEPEARTAPLSVFDLRTLDGMEQDELLLIEHYASGELLLTESDRLPDNPFERAERLLLEHYKAAEEPEPEAGEEPLLLDDILAELGPDSRVVRLFDPEAMPTPGQLKSKIDRHLEPGEDAADAGQALHHALADLRRSIR